MYKIESKFYKNISFSLNITILHKVLGISFGRTIQNKKNIKTFKN